MNKNKDIPEIRFEGFDGDWIGKRITSIADVKAGGDIDKDKLLKNGPYPVYANSTSKKKSVIGYYNDYKIKAPAVTLTARGDIGFPIVRTSNFTSVIRLLSLKFRPLDNVYFMENSLKRLTFLSETTGVPQLTAISMEKYSIKIPVKYEEQNQIGNFFKNLDVKLDLEKEKYEKLISLKKAMLDEMFPKEGEKVPKVRFEGFDDEWEENRLGDIVTFRRGSFPQPYGKKEWYDGEGAKPFVQVADISKEMKLENKTNQRISLLAQPKSVFAKKGTVVVSLQGSIGRVAITQYDAYIDRTVLIFDKYLRRINKLYWSYIISLKFRDEALKAPGGTIKTITKEVLSNFVLRIPSIEEQTLIGNFFNNLDEKIEFSKQKIGKIENFKKAMLEKMFV